MMGLLLEVAGSQETFFLSFKQDMLYFEIKMLLANKCVPYFLVRYAPHSSCLVSKQDDIMGKKDTDLCRDVSNDAMKNCFQILVI